VKVYYLPGFGPGSRAKFPFWATINQERALVDFSRGEVSFEYPDWNNETQTRWEEFNA